MNEAESSYEGALWQKVDPLIHDALGTLPDFDRNLILLRFFQEMSLREVGEELGLSENAARMRVSRSLAKMRSFLKKHGTALSVTTLAALMAERAAHLDLSAEVAESVSQHLAAVSTAGTASIPLTPMAKGVLATMLHSQIRRVFVAASAATAVLGVAAVAAHIVIAQNRAAHPGDIGPVALVRQYIAARAAANADATYELLSSDSRQQMLKSTYDQWQSISKGDSGQMPIPLLAFLIDAKNQTKANYQITGPETGDPEVVDVAAALPNAKAYTVKVVTIWDDTDHARRIDLMRTFETSDPALAHKAKSKAEATASMSNMKQLSIAIVEYASQTGRFPDADRWMDEILPSVKNPVLFSDPADPNGRQYGYAFNSALSGFPYNNVHNPPGTVLLFESTLGTKNGASLNSTLPDPGPINGNTGIAYVDGHVEIVDDGGRRKLNWQP